MDQSPEYVNPIAESRHPALRMFNEPLVTAAENQALLGSGKVSGERRFMAWSSD
jgi:hypothetical protein